MSMIYQWVSNFKILEISHKFQTQLRLDAASFARQSTPQPFEFDSE
jgi:hypothetical protein